MPQYVDLGMVESGCSKIDEAIAQFNDAKNILQVGDKVQTYILKFNPTDKRISLSAEEPKTEEVEEEATEETAE